MKLILSIIFILLVQLSSLKACLNIYYAVDKEGHLHEGDELHRSFPINFNKKAIAADLIKLEVKIKDKRSYMLLSDYAVYLMKCGETKIAKEILVVLNRNYPKEYKIASNLGTAYELNGELDSAIRYIQRGVELNPKAHDGSEWVHLQVLKTKQKLIKNPNYLDKETVLQLTDKQKKDTLIRDQIMIQMQERFPFSPGPDKIMASILIDLGDCYANTSSIEYAKALYTIAKEYFGDKSKKVDDRIKEMVDLRNKHASVHPTQQLVKQGGHLREGTHFKVGGIRYKDLLKDKNNPPFTIDWTKINTNLDSLLSYVDLEPLVEAEKIDTISKKPLKEKGIKQNINPKSNSWNKIIIGILLTLTAVVLGLWLYKKK